jgi:hypothetical protein
MTGSNSFLSLWKPLGAGSQSSRHPGEKWEQVLRHTHTHHQCRMALPSACSQSLSMGLGLILPRSSESPKSRGSLDKSC